MPHPLKTCCLVTLSGLLISQLSLFLTPVDPPDPYWVIMLSLPLLLPYKGLISDRLYTYQWTGFLCLFYFSVGISELVANPELKTYAYLSTVFSTVLFVSSIYYSRYLRFNS